jgi:hypothetical protein
MPRGVDMEKHPSKIYLANSLQASVKLDNGVCPALKPDNSIVVASAIVLTDAYGVAY